MWKSCIYFGFACVAFVANASAFQSTVQGRFIQRDPAGYVDGMSLLEVQRSNAVSNLDPSGAEILGKIVCDGKGNIVAAYPEKGDAGFDTMQIPCAKEIVEAHEGIHLADWAQYPHACRASHTPNGTPVRRGAPPLKPVGITDDDFSKWLAESEKRAWRDSRDRMRAIREANKCGHCERIQQKDGTVIHAWIKPTKEWKPCCDWIDSMINKAYQMAETGVYKEPQK